MEISNLRVCEMRKYPSVAENRLCLGFIVYSIRSLSELRNSFNEVSNIVAGSFFFLKVGSLRFRKAIDAILLVGG